MTSYKNETRRDEKIWRRIDEYQYTAFGTTVRRHHDTVMTHPIKNAFLFLFLPVYMGFPASHPFGFSLWYIFSALATHSDLCCSRTQSCFDFSRSRTGPGTLKLLSYFVFIIPISLDFVDFSRRALPFLAFWLFGFDVLAILFFFLASRLMCCFGYWRNLLVSSA